MFSSAPRNAATLKPVKSCSPFCMRTPQPGATSVAAQFLADLESHHAAARDLSGHVQPRVGSVPDRARFLAYASRAMRGLIIDYFRSRSAQKRGGEFEITVLPTEMPQGVESDAELQRLSETVDALAHIEPRLAQVVDLKFFCGFTFPEIGAVLGASERTVKRDWEKARILLQHELTES